jgi:hypothetical protein
MDLRLKYLLFILFNFKISLYCFCKKNFFFLSYYIFLVILLYMFFFLFSFFFLLLFLCLTMRRARLGIGPTISIKQHRMHACTFAIRCRGMLCFGYKHRTTSTSVSVLYYRGTRGQICSSSSS